MAIGRTFEYVVCDDQVEKASSLRDIMSNENGNIGLYTRHR
ncbi:hypothetical protein PALU110988_10415 [Paenibacillus lupini]|nr:hypothetical protein [Paenibacillus lupini]